MPNTNNTQVFTDPIWAHGWSRDIRSTEQLFDDIRGNRFEFRNTVRRAAHELHRSKKTVPFEVGNVLKQMDADLKTGVLRHVEPDWRETIRLAEDISAAHTEANGQGGVDTWHIAAAILCRAESFWTFDDDQAATALDFGRFKHVRP
jgi:hypothetical protein